MQTQEQKGIGLGMGYQYVADPIIGATLCVSDRNLFFGASVTLLNVQILTILSHHFIITTHEELIQPLYIFMQVEEIC